MYTNENVIAQMYTDKSDLIFEIQLQMITCVN